MNYKMLTTGPDAPGGPDGPGDPGLPLKWKKIKYFGIISFRSAYKYLYRTIYTDLSQMKLS